MRIWCSVAVLATVLAVAVTSSASNVQSLDPGKLRVVPGGPKLPASDLTIAPTTFYKMFSCALEGKYSKLDLSVVVKNIGPGPAMSSHGIQVRAYPDKKLLVDSVKYAISLEPVTYGPKLLNPGESFTASFVMTIGPAVDNLPYQIKVDVDQANSVPETNETNNTAVVLKIPALPVSCTAVMK